MSDKALVAVLRRQEPALPAPTCPEIDAAIEALEALRHSNAQLRDTVCHLTVFCREAADVIERLTAERDSWRRTPVIGLESAISEFKAALPGWWFSVGECQVSCDASCGPTRQSEHIGLIPLDDRFNSGFHADLPQPATLADALRVVMRDALAAIAMQRPCPTQPEST